MSLISLLNPTSNERYYIKKFSTYGIYLVLKAENEETLGWRLLNIQEKLYFREHFGRDETLIGKILGTPKIYIKLNQPLVTNPFTLKEICLENVRNYSPSFI